MRYNTLGSTDIRVSIVAMGCWSIAGGQTWGPQEESDSVAAIEASLEAGVNFFDTAEGYGDGYSEELLGRVLAGRRQHVVIATKVSPSHLRPADLKAACERSLRRLRTDYVDLYQIHWPSREVPVAETASALLELREQGKVRAIGCSNFGVGDLDELLRHADVVTDQLPYSLLWRAIEFEIQPLCVERGVGILPYSPLAQGLLTGKFRSPDEVPEGRARTRLFSGRRPRARHGESGAEEETFQALESLRAICQELGLPMAQVALAWLLSRPGVCSVLAGARNARQARANAAAGDLELPADALDRLTAATEALKQRLGPNPDMWQSEGRLR